MQNRELSVKNQTVAKAAIVRNQISKTEMS